jgi:DNA modification methylase
VNLGTARVIRADARQLPLEDNSVDLVITSPPYFALRSYQDGGEHYAGQIGDEPTPDAFVDSLLEVTRECVRVLKPTGSLWVNLGDKYAGAPSGPRSGMPDGATRKAELHEWQTRRKVTHAVPTKSLIGIPWRYALRCIDDLGLILRAEVIWSKPNGLPESVTDRVRRSHEQWFHFTLQPRYFSAVDEIREPYDPKTQARYDLGFRPEKRLQAGIVSTARDASILRGDSGPTTTNPLGKLPGSVWTVPTEPLRVPDHLGVDHFAAFPTEWPRRIIQGWSPSGVCTGCGEGRRPVGEKDRRPTQRTHNGHGFMSPDHGGRDSLPHRTIVTLTGYACACPEPTAPTTPATILDPFGGTGTVAMVAKALGRHGISVDMSADYCRLATWRVNDRDQLAKVLGIEKAEKPHADEQSLLDLLDGGAA